MCFNSPAEVHASACRDLGLKPFQARESKGGRALRKPGGAVGASHIREQSRMCVQKRGKLWSRRGRPVLCLDLIPWRRRKSREVDSTKIILATLSSGSLVLMEKGSKTANVQ